MLTEAFVMPNEGHLGGFDIRKFIKRFMTIGLVISIGFHFFVIGVYKFVLYIESRQIPPPLKVIYLDPSNLGPPPALSGEDIAPALKIAQPKLAPPAAAIPKPIVEEIAEEQPVIQSQQELSQTFDAQIDCLALGGNDENIEIKEAIPDEYEKAPVFIPYEQEPKIVKKVDPIYPEMAGIAGINGKVTVQFYVDKNGIVKNAVIMKAEPKGLGFEEAAIAAIKQWKFTPALQQNRPVGVWVANTFIFKMK
jgi:TonB family protein